MDGEKGLWLCTVRPQASQNLMPLIFRKDIRATPGTAIIRKVVGAPDSQMNPRKITPIAIMKGGRTLRLSGASRLRRKKTADPRDRSAQKTKKKIVNLLFMSN